MSKLVQRNVTKTKLIPRFVFVISAFSLIGTSVFLVFFGTQMGRSKVAEAAPVTYTTLAAGNWSNAVTVWSTNGLTPCACTPGLAPNSKNIVINHNINMTNDITVLGTSIISIAASGRLSNVSYKLDVQGGSITTYGIVSVKELTIGSAATATFSGPVTAASRIRIDGTALLNALTTVTSGDMELRSGSTITVADGWQANLPAGDIVNEGTMTFDANLFIMTNGDFFNKSPGIVRGFGYIETKNGNISNTGTWNSYVDWCASAGQPLNGLPDAENCFAPAGSPTTCESSYTLNWKDASTYNVDCGDVNAANWSVKGMTCWYTSPLFNVPGVVGGPNRLADFTVRINQSGNVDANDTATVYYYVNGAVSRADIYPGTGSPAVFTSARKILVYAGGTYQVKIRLKNDQSNELWQVKNDDVTICLLSVYPPPSPLPVSLLNFNVKAQNDNTVLLNWVTEAELNNDYFTLEKSQDGTHFSVLTKVDGAGNSTNIHKYSFSDDNPFSGISYYRLKQTDFNGRSYIYKPVSVMLKTVQSTVKAVQVAPNPFSDSFMAQFEADAKEEVQVKIFNTSGMMVFSDKIIAEVGLNMYRFTTPSQFTEGNYIFSLSNSQMPPVSKKIVYRKN